MENKPQMEYRYLGSTGIQVSAISYGCMDMKDQELLNQIVQKAYELGINFFDCAETYGNPRGTVETLLGNALKTLKADREDLVISSKIFWAGDVNQVNKRGLSRKHLIEGVRNSLKRMQLTYFDILFAHRYDPYCPMEEIVRAFDWIVRHGYARYWGTSEWPAQKIEQAMRICEKYRLIKPVVEQPQYNMIERERFEKEYFFLFKDYKFGTTIWSPLGGGLLTGKYNTEIPDDSRLLTSPMNHRLKTLLAPENIEKTRAMTKKIEDIAKEIGASSAQLALAWTLRNKDVSTALIGARKMPQLEENIQALQFVSKITPEIEERIDQALGNKPESYFDYVNMKNGKSRREL